MESKQKEGKTAKLAKERRDSSDDNAEECLVCLTSYDDKIQRPRNLPCGHTFCTPCINGLKNQDEVMCPTCRFVHAVPETGQFPISFALEALMRKMRGVTSASLKPKVRKDAEESTPSSVTEPDQKESAGLSKSIRSMLQEQESKILAAIRTCHDVSMQLDLYKKTIKSWGERQQQLEDNLQALVDQSKSARVRAGYEESRVDDTKEQVQEGEKKLDALLQELRSATTDEEFGVKMVEVARYTDEERQKVEECQLIFPNADIVTTLSKVEMTSRAARKAAQKAVEDPPTGAAEDSNLPADPASTITERLQALLAPTLEAEDLRIMTQPTKILLEAGRLFATHKMKGRSRHGKISLEDGRLYLHSLKDQPPIPDAVILQMEEVVPAAPPCLAFLDLAWRGSDARRVLIELSPDTPMGRQFAMLCTGQRGPCYANTRLYKVHHKGQPGERVGGGDYDKNNGKGGDALLPDLDKGDYQHSCQAGAVCRVNRDASDWNARFGIYTKGCQSDVPGVFGKVVSGLKVVAAAAQHTPIKEVTVVDCGVVLQT